MISKLEDMDEHHRDKVNTSIVSDVDVQYYMAYVTEDLEEEERKELLHTIVNLYVTICGFSDCGWKCTSKKRGRNYRSQRAFAANLVARNR